MIYLIISFAIIGLILNNIILRDGISDILYNFEIENPVVEIGEDIIVKSTIENYKHLPIPYISITETFPSGFSNRLHKITLLIKARERVIRKHVHAASSRGLFNTFKVDIKLGDFLGFKDIHVQRYYYKSIYVKPKIVPLAEQISPFSSNSGRVSVKRWIHEDPLMITGVREYTHNDPQKLIHWPSSLKASKLMVKTFDHTSESSILICLNMETSKPGPQSPLVKLIEDSIITTRSIVDELDKKKIEFSFINNSYNRISRYERGYSVANGTGKSHTEKVLELLARLDYKPDLRFHKMILTTLKKNVTFTSFVLVTPIILDEYIETINEVARKVPKVILITHDDKNINKISNLVEVYRGRNHE